MRGCTCLKTALAEELIACAEGHLDDGAELGHLTSDIVLDIGDAFKVGNELLDDGFPCSEPFDEDVGGAEVVRSDVLLDERLAARRGRAVATRRSGEGRCTGDRHCLVHGE